MFSNKKNLKILKKAFDVIAREQAAELPSPEECGGITFSAQFENKMQKLIERQSKPYYYLINTVGKRVACIVIAALITLTSITFGVKAIREAVIEFFVETFEKFSIVGFKEDVSESLEYIETYYIPTYIPEGYELKFDDKLLSYRNIEYESKNNLILFRQNLIHTKSTYLDTEDASYEEVSVLDKKAFYTVKDKIALLYWNNSKYSFFIQTESNLEKEELIKIAESIKAE